MWGWAAIGIHSTNVLGWVVVVMGITCMCWGSGSHMTGHVTRALMNIILITSLWSRIVFYDWSEQTVDSHFLFHLAN